MKLLFLFSFLIIAGCSSSSAPVPPYSPGGEFYTATGSFVGTWEPIVNGNTIDTNHCTVIITESDSIVKGTITNDSTGEVIQITGYHDVLPDIVEDPNGRQNYLHFYWTQYVSSMGDTGSSAPLNFLNGNGFSFGCLLKQSPQQDTTFVEIDCMRQ